MKKIKKGNGRNAIEMKPKTASAHCPVMFMNATEGVRYAMEDTGIAYLE